MPITEQKEGIGGFEFGLLPSTPRAVRDAIKPFGYIFVTPVWYPSTAVSSRGLLMDTCRWAGVVVNRSGEGAKISGYGIAAMLGFPSGTGVRYFGDNTWVVTDLEDAIVDHANAPLQAARGINGGTISGADLVEGHSAGDTPLDVLRRITAHTKASWKITYNDGTDHFGLNASTTGTDVFASGKVLLWSGVGDVEHGTSFFGRALVALQSDIDVTWTVEEYNSGVTVNESDLDSASFSTSETLFKDVSGDDMNDWTVYARVPAAYTGIAEAMGEPYDTEVPQVTVSCDVLDPHRFMQPGDTVYLYAPEHELWGGGTMVSVGGQAVFPLSYDLEGMIWPIEADYGVYHHRNDGTNDIITDLTPYIQPESGPVELTVGSLPRSPGVQTESARIPRNRANR